MAKVTGCPSLEMSVEGVTSFCNESSCADDNPGVSKVIAKRSRQWVHPPIEERHHSPVCRPLSHPHALFILHQELDRWDCHGPRRPHSHPGRSCERGRLRCLRKTTTTTSTWLSALLPSVVVGPRRSAHGLLCSGCVYLSCSRSHDRGHLMPSLLSPSPFGAESTQSVGKRLPCSG